MSLLNFCIQLYKLKPGTGEKKNRRQIVTLAGYFYIFRVCSGDIQESNFFEQKAFFVLA
jgi:hypothetical protein